MEQLVVLKGQENDLLKNIHFENISFAYSAYFLPPTGHDGTQAANYYSFNSNDPDNGRIKNAVHWEYVHQSSIKNCRVFAIGSSAIGLLEGCQHNILENNTVTHYGANGISLGLKNDPGNNQQKRVSHNQVIGNTIKNGGTTFPSGLFQ